MIVNNSIKGKIYNLFVIMNTTLITVIECISDLRQLKKITKDFLEKLEL